MNLFVVHKYLLFRITHRLTFIVIIIYLYILTSDNLRNGTSESRFDGMLFDFFRTLIQRCHASTIFLGTPTPHANLRVSLFNLIMGAYYTVNILLYE